MNSTERGNAAYPVAPSRNHSPGSPPARGLASLSGNTQVRARAGPRCAIIDTVHATTLSTDNRQVRPSVVTRIRTGRRADTPQDADITIIYGTTVVDGEIAELGDVAELDGTGVAGATGCEGAVAGADGRELTTFDCRYTSHPTTVPTGAS